MISPNVLAIACLVSAGSAFWIGWEWRDRSADLEAAVAAQQRAELYQQAQAAQTIASEQARNVERLTAERTALASEAAALRDQEREVVERVVTREVIRYVQNPNTVRTVLPFEWVRIHDRAATGRGAGMPAATDGPRRPDAVAAPVTDADALVVITDNYTTCQATRDQLIGLQDWVRSLNLDGVAVAQ